MFGQYPFIHKQHAVALASVVRNHSVTSSVSAPLLAKMYNLAVQGLKSPVVDQNFFTSSMRSGNIVMSNVTDAKTGLWIQLATVEGQSFPYLTAGQKWAMEQYVQAHNSVSTTLW